MARTHLPDSPDRLYLDFQAALAGRYSLERELGRGGMGVVYLAREVSLDRPVAIKLLPPELAAHQALRQRFQREARMAARLAHPHIVPIHSVDEVGRFTFYVMAYVRGETLAHRIAARGALPPAEAVRVLREVAWALAHAHAQGVVHRDVKPENILLEDGSGRALVTDFGIARQVQSSGPTGVGEALGTPDFMSPEQASGERVDQRSDVYSLGVVAFYALAGRLPFTGTTVAARMSQHITQAPPPLPTVAPGVPRTLAGVVGRCLAKDPALRYGDGSVLAEALSLALDRRRELPSALRMYLAEADSISVHRLFPSFLLGGLAIWLVESLTLSPILAPGPVWVEILLDVVAFGVMGVSVLGPGGIALHRLRRVARAGHDHDDLVRALATDAARLREDYTAVTGRAPGRHQGLVHGIWLGATTTLAVFLFSALLDYDWVFPELMGAVAGLAGVVSLFGAGVAWRASVFSGLRQRFWASAPGRWLYRLAGLGLRRGDLPAVAGNRPTEIVVGLAAEALYDALPREVRRALPDLPDVVRRLREDAQRIRRRCDDLAEALGGAESVAAQGFSGAGGAGLEARRVAVVTDLRAAQASAQRRLADTVAALEAIRLDLLRLRVGAGSVESITADLSAARELSEAAERLLEAAEEVDGMLPGRTEADRDGQGRTG
ncbi:MAG TPA: protein kinase [Gemmatimonadales bacterium]|nr:protein kinase [Gemmatimonadales bacterium]